MGSHIVNGRFKIDIFTTVATTSVSMRYVHLSSLSTVLSPSYLTFSDGPNQIFIQ